MKAYKILSLLLALCLVGVACKKDKGPRSDTILHAHLHEDPETLDPNLATGQEATYVIIEIFEGLTRNDPKTLAPLPGVASSWKVSPDGKTYLFQLRPDAQWSDGSPVTAHDFTFAWERILNPATGGRYAFTLHGIRNAKAYNLGELKDPKQLGFKAFDDHTLEVTLEHPLPYFLELLSFKTFFPVPKKVVTVHGERWSRPENVLCNGPFVLKSWVPQKVIELTKNGHYWGASEVSLENVNFHPIPDDETALKKYLAGELDTLYRLPSFKTESLKDHPEVIRQPYFSIGYFKVNTTRPPLNDSKVRRALALAIDRKNFLATLKSPFIPQGHAVPDGLSGYTSIDGMTFNSEEAHRLLAQAGFPGGKNFPMLTLHYSTSDDNKMMAELLQRMFKENLGINVQLFNEEWKVYLASQRALNFDLSMAAWVGDYLDPNTFLDLHLSESQMGNTGWKNPEFDRLIHEAALIQGTQKRMQLLAQAEALLLKEAPIIPIYQKVALIMAKPYIKGYYPTIMHLHPLRNVSLKK